ncbi:thioredoxin [Croceimicrobium hydrocarbonivorans]|nr:thioredoxin [Croceimicrobium hydrocarbonivorans]
MLLLPLQRKTRKMPTVKLSTEQFKKDVFDYTQYKEWKYQGNKPAIIDFYADWCGPCQMVAPIFEELSDEYKDDIIIYKVDTEVEQELAGAFGIQSIPSILFIPMEGTPMMSRGAMPKHNLQKVIEEELMVSK